MAWSKSHLQGEPAGEPVLPPGWGLTALPSAGQKAFPLGEGRLGISQQLVPLQQQSWAQVGWLQQAAQVPAPDQVNTGMTLPLICSLSIPAMCTDGARGAGAALTHSSSYHCSASLDTHHQTPFAAGLCEELEGQGAAKHPLWDGGLGAYRCPCATRLTPKSLCTCQRSPGSQTVCKLGHWPVQSHFHEVPVCKEGGDSQGEERHCHAQVTDG